MPRMAVVTGIRRAIQREPWVPRGGRRPTLGEPCARSAQREHAGRVASSNGGASSNEIAIGLEQHTDSNQIDGRESGLADGFGDVFHRLLNG